MPPLNPILRSGIKAVGFIGSRVIVARDFALMFLRRFRRVLQPNFDDRSFGRLGLERAKRHETGVAPELTLPRRRRPDAYIVAG